MPAIERNTERAKRDRQVAGIATTIGGAVAIVGVVEIPPRINAEIAAALSPVFEASVLILLPPTVFGALLYATGGSLLVYKMLRLYFGMLLTSLIVGMILLPLFLWMGFP